MPWPFHPNPFPWVESSCSAPEMGTSSSIVGAKI
jgi:hypothetical protein